MGAHELLDIEANAIMKWRFLGENWEGETEDDDNTRNAALEAVLKSISDADLENFRAVLSRSNLNTDDIDFGEGDGFCAAENIPKMAESMVNSILANVLQVHGDTLSRLPASVQFQITDDVIMLKRAMIDKVTSTWTKKKKFGPEEAREIVAYLSEQVQNVRDSRGL